ncbi:MAG: hypothetical protein HRT51_05500 [Colwellia sp.]|nr:hypothetical protein [Colwellia sp.]
MSNLIADRNTLQMLQGVEGYNEWMHWAFEKALTQLENECEDTWLDRLLHTAMAIEEQIEFTENQAYSDISAQQKEVTRLTNRLRNVGEIIGFIPTNRGIENREYLTPYNSPASEYPNKEKSYAQNKLLQVITLLLKENINSSIHDVWSYFHSNQGNEIFDLIEVISVNDLTSPTAVICWRDAKTGVEGKSQTRKSMATAIAKIRKTLKY